MAPAPPDQPIVLVSNRGPVSFERTEPAQLTSKRGAGGLVSGIGPLAADGDVTWLAAAMSDDDREAASAGVVEADGFRVRLLDLDAETFRLAYDVVSNEVLWFAHHGLWDLTREPAFDAVVGRRVGRVPRGEPRLRRRGGRGGARPAPPSSCRTTTCAWWPPGSAPPAPTSRACTSTTRRSPRRCGSARCPTRPARELLEGLAAHRACGFHSQRWADDFRSSSRALADLEPTAFVAPLASDPADIRAAAASPECAAALAALEEVVQDRVVIGRVDRVELSKNILRGFQAYRELLETQPRAPRAGGVRGQRLRQPHRRARLRRLPRAGRARGPRRSTTGSAPTGGSRSCSTWRTTSRGRSRCSAAPTCSS